MMKYLFYGSVLLLGGSMVWTFLPSALLSGVQNTPFTQIEDLGDLDFQEKLKSLQFPVDVKTEVQKRPHQYRLVLGVFRNHTHADERRFEVLTAGVSAGIEKFGEHWRVVTSWYDTPTEVDKVVSQLLHQGVESEMETRILKE